MKSLCNLRQELLKVKVKGPVQKWLLPETRGETSNETLHGT